MKNTAFDHAFDQVHGRRADELSDKEVAGAIEQFQWGADLLDDAVVHDHNAIGHGHGFDLIVGHIHSGGFQTLVQGLDFGPHGDA